MAEIKEIMTWIALDWRLKIERNTSNQFRAVGEVNNQIFLLEIAQSQISIARVKLT